MPKLLASIECLIADKYNAMNFSKKVYNDD